MSDTILWFPQSSNGRPIKCIDNGDGTYSLSVVIVGTQITTFTETETVTVTKTKKDKN